jgi:allantoinase
MPTPLLAIHSKNVLLPDGIKDATVLIEGGVITGVAEGLPEGFEGGGAWAVDMGAGVVDVGDKVLMPGVIDPHVHINEPGRTEWEGFDTATRSALAGGLTTLVDMPLNSSPVTTTAEGFDRKFGAAEGRVHCHCGFWGGLVPGNEGEIEALIGRGVLGFKAFLTHSGIDEFPNVTEADLRKAMPVIAYYNLPLLVHCELESARWGNEKGAGAGGRGAGERVSGEGGGKGADEGEGKGEGGGWGTRGGGDPRNYRNYLLSRPARWEDDAIALMIRLCEEYGCRTHIVHLSSAGSIEPIRRAKDRGLPLTVETAQHYLYFAAERIGEGQTLLKCAPPIRESANNEQLWEALKEGVIDLVATDHSPAPPAMKELESGDFSKAWGGISSLQFALPVLWTAARSRGVDMARLVKWCCEGPASLIGESGKRGKIAPGYIADMVIWDPAQPFRVTREGIHHKHAFTPYLDEELYGVVEQTWLEGVKVFDKGAFTRLNRGKIIVR